MPDKEEYAEIIEKRIKTFEALQMTLDTARPQSVKLKVKFNEQLEESA